MPHDPNADLATVLGCDVAALGLAELVAVLAPVRRLNGLLDHFEASVNNRISELHEQGRSAPVSDVLTRNTNVSAKEAARRERRAKALANTKAFGEALSEVRSAPSTPTCSPTSPPNSTTRSKPRSSTRTPVSVRKPPRRHQSSSPATVAT